MNKIGYARVSTNEQNLDLQIDALEQAGCTHIFKDDGVSAVAECRPGFDEALAALKSGDALFIWKLDRAFRSVKHAVLTLETFEKRCVLFRCLTEPIDTTTSIGRFTYQIRNAFAELERNIIRERTIAGMDAARRRGAKIGRPRKLSGAQISNIQTILNRHPASKLDDIAVNFGVSPRTLSRALLRV